MIGFPSRMIRNKAKSENLGIFQIFFFLRKVVANRGVWLNLQVLPGRIGKSGQISKSPKIGKSDRLGKSKRSGQTLAVMLSESRRHRASKGQGRPWSSRSANPDRGDQGGCDNALGTASKREFEEPRRGTIRQWDWEGEIS